MSWVTLPITAEVVGGGEAVDDMPSMVGWGTFTVEHALFGFVLGTLGGGSSGRDGPARGGPRGTPARGLSNAKRGQTT
ncbi:MAG TPA: hypothetical protein VF129_11465 [Actinomycetota bacterium]